MKAIRTLHLESVKHSKLTHSQVSAIMAIKQIECISGKAPQPSQLSEEFCVSPATITPVINKLENLGLIKREYSKEDRRQVFIQLTDEGNLEFEAIHKHMMDYYNRMVESVGNDAIDSFIAFTKKVDEFNKTEQENSCSNKQ